MPQDVQGAILAVDLRKKLETITEKQKLHLDQAGALENETLFIMLGLEHPKDYIRNVMRELSVDTDTAKKIAMDVNEQIFRPIRESLKKIHNVDEPATDPKVQQADYGAGNKRQTTATPQSSVKQEKLNAEPSTLNAGQEDHPILRLKKELPKKSLESRGTVVGWPVKDESEKSPKATLSAGQVAGQVKVGSRTTGEQTSSKQSNLQPKWSPKPPEKNAPAPINLPVETETNGAPKTGAYPPVKEQTMDNKQQTTMPEKPEQKAQDSVVEKLSGSFKLPRTETEYKEKQRPVSSPPNYGGGDPYRESVD